MFQHAGMPILQNLLEQFQPIGEFVKNCLDINPLPSPGSMEYLYCGVYIYLENIMDTGKTVKTHPLILVMYLCLKMIFFAYV